MAYFPMFQTSIYLTLLVLIYAQEPCLIPPPEVQNARSVIMNITHGNVIEYHCSRHFRKTSNGPIICIDGRWRGEPPICKDTRCHVESLWEEGLEKSKKAVYYHSEIFTPSCIAGYDLRAITRNIKCHFGRWMTLPSSPCEPARCVEEPPEIKNGEILNHTKTHLSDVSYKCNQGYEMVYSPETVKCMFGSWTGLAPFCRQSFISSDVSCKELEAPRNGNILSILGRQTAGSMIQYGCNLNFDLLGVATTICLESGKWASPPPVCIEKCIIPNVENGTIRMARRRLQYDRLKPQSFIQSVVHSRVKNGTELYVMCNGTKFEPPGIQSKAFKISCINGVWSPEPKCFEKMKCEIPKKLQNGKVHYDSLEKGSELYYECNKGFQLDVTQTRTCSDDGTWTGEEPNCRAEMKCETPKDLKNGNVYYDSLEKGSDLYYECNKGFQLDVIQTRTCSDDGTWTGEEPSCREPCTIPKVENGVIGEYKKMYKYEGGIRTEMIFSESVVHSRAKNNTALLLKCIDTRFEPAGAQAKELNISCINEIWSHPLICIAASCKKPPPQVKNAVIITKDIAHGTILRYVCAKHFTKTSFGAVTCQYGQWTGQSPICKSTHCHTKDIRPDEGIVNSEALKLVASGNYADISCKEKYYLKYEKPRCLNGTWSYHNEFSPCQIRDHCIVPDIQGTFSRPVNIKRFKYWRYENVLEYTKVEPGWHVENGEELTVKCNPSYFFPVGADTHNFNISCVGGEWHPSPICKPESIATPIFTDVKSSISAISFAWDFPPILIDSIDGYVLSCEEKGKEMTGEKTETFIDKIHRNYTIKNLEPSKEYQIVLQAYKSDIRSEPVSSFVKTSLDFEVPSATTECSIPSLVDNLPENVVIDVEVEDIVSETVPEGRVFHLTCGTVGMQPIGERSATCDSNGRWRVGKDVKCVIACGPIKKPVGSNLIIEPEKDMYRFGETVIFSCPLGQSLNSTTVRIMCLRERWSSESVPHCRND